MVKWDQKHIVDRHKFMVKKEDTLLVKYTRNKNKIKNFIETELEKKLEEDQANLKIITEGDLQSLVYYHLKIFFGNEEIEKFYIFNKIKLGNTYPDIIISYMEPRGKPYVDFIIELKENYGFYKKDVNDDLKKLNKLAKTGTWQTYFIYSVFERKPENQEKLDNLIKCSVEIKNKSVIAIVVNMCKKRPTKASEIENQFDIMWNFSKEHH